MASVSDPASSPDLQASAGQSTHPFTCNTCQVAFRSSELQRAHMQTDWHRYNLKRRVASLPPLPSEVFTEKVLANRASAAATAARATFEKACTPCQKTYYSENAFRDHLRSQRHRANETRQHKQQGNGAGAPDRPEENDTGSMVSSAFSLGEPLGAVVGDLKGVPVEDAASAAATPTPPPAAENDDHVQPSTSQPVASSAQNAPTDNAATPAEPPAACLFCNYDSPNFRLNMSHMERYHGLFIPEQEYLIDRDGLVLYLDSKIREEHTCLYCNKEMHTAAGTQTHMRDRGHCMIAFGSEDEMLEIGQFYDFRGTYPEPCGSTSEEEEEDASDATDSTADATPPAAAKLGARRRSTTAHSGDEKAEDDGWETDSTQSSIPSEEITSVPIDDFSHRYAALSRHRHHSHAEPPHPHRAADGHWHSHAHTTPRAVYHDDCELHLPSGRRVGHRRLKVYWQQNLRRYPGLADGQARMLKGESENDDDDEGESEGVRVNGHDGADTEGDGGGRQLVTRGTRELGMVGVTDAKRREVRKAEKRERGRETRARERKQAGVERRNNMQKHFRDPLLQ